MRTKIYYTVALNNVKISEWIFTVHDIYTYSGIVIFNNKSCLFSHFFSSFLFQFIYFYNRISILPFCLSIGSNLFEYFYWRGPYLWGAYYHKQQSVPNWMWDLNFPKIHHKCSPIHLLTRVLIILFLYYFLNF